MKNPIHLPMPIVGENELVEALIRAGKEVDALKTENARLTAQLAEREADLALWRNAHTPERAGKPCCMVYAPLCFHAAEGDKPRHALGDEQ